MLVKRLADRWRRLPRRADRSTMEIRIDANLVQQQPEYFRAQPTADDRHDETHDDSPRRDRQDLEKDDLLILLQ